MTGLPSGKVMIVEYQPDWSEEYRAEKTILSNLIGHLVLDIQHIGSTSIDQCSAKPVIDIAIAIHSIHEADELVELLTAHGYEYRGDAGIPGRHFFTKGTKENRTHYLHVEELNGALWENHILFRDYLRRHPQSVAEYCALKKKIAEQYPEDRERYTEGKSSFITGIIERAKEELSAIK